MSFNDVRQIFVSPEGDLTTGIGPVTVPTNTAGELSGLSDTVLLTSQAVEDYCQALIDYDGIEATSGVVGSELLFLIADHTRGWTYRVEPAVDIDNDGEFYLLGAAASTPAGDPPAAPWSETPPETSGLVTLTPRVIHRINGDIRIGEAVATEITYQKGPHAGQGTLHNMSDLIVLVRGRIEDFTDLARDNPEGLEFASHLNGDQLMLTITDTAGTHEFEVIPAAGEHGDLCLLGLAS
jgi:hypothetical protein